MKNFLEKACFQKRSMQIMRLDLNKNWHVCFTELEYDWTDFKQVLEETANWMTGDVPCDVREILIREGIIKEPLNGLNCFESEWVENKAWWFKKDFQVDAELLQGDRVELVLESLDIGADIIVNGQFAGHQASAFYPFRADIRDLLKEGDNQILIRITTGLERVNAEELSKYNISSEEERRPGRGDIRRALLRKPQYSFGWDWGPRVSTCGIVKNAWLESHKKAAIRWVRTCVKLLQPKVRLNFTLEVENFHPFSTLDCCARISMTLHGKPVSCCETDVLLKSGMNYIDVEMELEDAKLWWPNGMGDQPLYTVKVEMDVDGSTIQYPEYQYGIRTVNIDTSRFGDRDRHFTIVINGVRTFCKGGNWIPADSVYARVSDKKYKKLILEAKEANFNMLRVWGGGLYERDVFYEECDRLGIMIWHDFMFSCSEYPDDQEAFLYEVEKELDYQTKKLRNHPSLVLWCGNNENTWFFDEGYQTEGYFGAKIYNYMAPETVRKNCPDIPYWNSSPYGGTRPNGSESGDRHLWFDFMMNPEMQKRIMPEEYDKASAKFVSEFGYIGPLKRSSIERYMDGAPFDISGEVWQHHNNTFEKDTVMAGIRYHYGVKGNLDIDGYLLYAGLCQGIMYGYSLESFRYKPECSGALFWMFNDCWGETGWSIIDYYLVRKISYYFVKRAFAPVKFILRFENGTINVVGINDGPSEKVINVEYGYVSFDGTVQNVKETILTLGAHSREKVMCFSKGNFDETQGVYYLKAVEDKEVPLAVLRTGTYREMNMPMTHVCVQKAERRGSTVFLTVASTGFAHAVHFDLPDNIRLSDEYFDMLPGDSRTIEIYDAADCLDARKIVPHCINEKR